MIEELFSFEDEFDGGHLEVIYKECTLKVDIGKYRAGEEFDEITVDYEDGKIIFPDGEEFYLAVRVKGA